MNLILAIIWLVLAVLTFYHEATEGPLQLRIRWGGLNISLGWVMLLLACYNLARWYGNRLYRREWRELQEAARRREHTRRPEPLGEPDPNFQFTEEPRLPAPPNRHNPPPSDN